MSYATAALALAKLIKEGASKPQILKRLSRFGDDAVKEVKESKVYRTYMKKLTPGQKQTKIPTQAQASVKRTNLRKNLEGAGAGSLLTAGILDEDDKKDKGRKGRGDGNLEIKTRRKDKEPTSVAEARRKGMDYYIGKDGKRKKAIFAEELKPKAKPKAKDKARVLSSTDASTAKSYNKGGVIRANAGASVPPNRMSRK
tara:strand:- start:480 stop:1076 length:597 start_codon:yes stop_codon:yes gene_type:complete